MKKNHTTSSFIGIIAALALASVPARAAVAIDAVSSPTQSAYSLDVITGDLLSGLTGVASAGLAAGGTTVVLTDDSFGADSTLGDNAWVEVGTTITFDLDLTGAPDGYDLTKIQTFLGWTSGLYDQHYTVSVSPNQGVEDFTDLTTVQTTGFATTDNASKVTITDDDSGVLATGVKSIRFTSLPANPAGNNRNLWREFDVEGTPSGTSTGGSTFALTIAQDGPELDFTWASQEGMFYRLKSSADLSADFSTWDLVDEDLPATAPLGSTSITRPGDPFLFYRMEEYPIPPLTVFSESL